MKIVTILGARPQFIKAATVSRAIIAKAEVENISESIIHTGQHYDPMMSDVFFSELYIPKPSYNLNVGSGSHGFQTAKMLEGIELILLDEKPDIVLVYGDTNSTLAGALAASKLHIPIAHIEAGLRSFNRKMPEETNRILTDHLSTLLLCPTETAVNNLAREGIDKNVINVGDVMQDAAVDAFKSKPTSVLKKLGLFRQKYHMMTVHRAENTDYKEKIVAILTAIKAIKFPVVWPIHPRTKLVLKKMDLRLPSNVVLIEPLSYFNNIELLAHSKSLLTDSGGMQKEAYWLGVPCVTLREETEWVETVKAGWNILVGSNTNQIVDAIKNIEIPKNRPEILGSVGASQRVVNVLLEKKH